MRTTLDLPDPLFKEVKTRAVQEGVKLKDLLAKYIEAGLRTPKAPETDATRRKNPYPLPAGISRTPDSPLHPAMTNAELNAILEEEDMANHLRVISESSKTT